MNFGFSFPIKNKDNKRMQPGIDAQEVFFTLWYPAKADEYKATNLLYTYSFKINENYFIIITCHA
jgi:hypothetical protein